MLWPFSCLKALVDPPNNNVNLTMMTACPAVPPGQCRGHGSKGGTSKIGENVWHFPFFFGPPSGFSQSHALVDDTRHFMLIGLLLDRDVFSFFLLRYISSPKKPKKTWRRPPRAHRADQAAGPARARVCACCCTAPRRWPRAAGCSTTMGNRYRLCNRVTRVPTTTARSCRR